LKNNQAVNPILQLGVLPLKVRDGVAETGHCLALIFMYFSDNTLNWIIKGSAILIRLKSYVE
jgi:hypothetical protein